MSQIQINEARWLFLNQFWPLLNQVSHVILRGSWGSSENWPEPKDKPLTSKEYYLQWCLKKNTFTVIRPFTGLTLKVIIFSFYHSFIHSRSRIKLSWFNCEKTKKWNWTIYHHFYHHSSSPSTLLDTTWLNFSFNFSTRKWVCVWVC